VIAIAAAGAAAEATVLPAEGGAALAGASWKTAYTVNVKQIWTGRVVEAAGRYGEQAPMAAVCCNACRTCLTANIVGLLAATGGVVAAKLVRFSGRVVPRR
jgi:hypothetical protein